MESQEDSYTIGQLIKDLSSYETLIERSEGFRRRQAGQQAIKGSHAAHYAIQAAVTRDEASKVKDRIPLDAFDLIRPLCEIRGDEFDTKTLKTLRANIRIWSGEKESEINAMSLSDFAEVSADLAKKGLKRAERFSEKVRGAQAGLQAAMERISTPPLVLPDHMMPTDDSEITKAKQSLSENTNEDDPRNGMTAEQMMVLLLDKQSDQFNPKVIEWSARKFAAAIHKSPTSVKNTKAWKRLQQEKRENRESITSVKKGKR